MNRINPAPFSAAVADWVRETWPERPNLIAIAATIRAAGADDLLALKANQPTLRAEVESLCAETSPDRLDTVTVDDKGHGRIKHRTVSVARETDWLEGSAPLSGRDTFLRLLHPAHPRRPRQCAGAGRSRPACTGSST